MVLVNPGAEDEPMAQLTSGGSQSCLSIAWRRRLLVDLGESSAL